MASNSENTKAFLFAKWLAMNYADEHIDGGLSVLNRETGHWYKEQLKHFNEVAYPSMKKNGTVNETRSFLSDLSNTKTTYPEWKD
jgi:FAD/FMN-containing dehydrogenase